MKMPSEQESLWKVALECAYKRKMKKCLNKYGDTICANCRWYVLRYIDANPRQAELFMLQAESEVADMLQVNRQSNKGIVYLILGILTAIALFLAVMCNEGRYANKQQPTPVQQVQQSSQPAPQQKPTYINWTLDKVAETMHDTNADGKVNCIDAAVLFYQYYPEKDDVRIYLNYNPPKMNHLFILLSLDGVWYGVEPQATYLGLSSYWMSEVWGRDYDRRFNKDVTRDYIKFVR